MTHSLRLPGSWALANAVDKPRDQAQATAASLVRPKAIFGAIFSALLGSIFASSIQLFISINVVALLIVGGQQLRWWRHTHDLG